jgi:hypothetical protein
MNPELAAFLQKSMCMTDEELSRLEGNAEELEALLDVVFDPDSLAGSHISDRTPLRERGVASSVADPNAGRR